MKPPVLIVLITIFVAGLGLLAMPFVKKLLQPSEVTLTAETRAYIDSKFQGQDGVVNDSIPGLVSRIKELESRLAKLATTDAKRAEINALIESFDQRREQVAKQISESKKHNRKVEAALIRNQVLPFCVPNTPGKRPPGKGRGR